MRVGAKLPSRHGRRHKRQQLKKKNNNNDSHRGVYSERREGQTGAVSKPCRDDTATTGVRACKHRVSAAALLQEEERCDRGTLMVPSRIGHLRRAEKQLADMAQLRRDDARPARGSHGLRKQPEVAQARTALSPRQKASVVAVPIGARPPPIIAPRDPPRARAAAAARVIIGCRSSPKARRRGGGTTRAPLCWNTVPLTVHPPPLAAAVKGPSPKWWRYNGP